MPDTTPRNIPYVSILEEADAIVNGARATTYGDMRENWERTASIASALTGIRLSASDCTKIMLAVKLARLHQSPDHRDSYVDLAGYTLILSKLNEVK